MCASVQNTSIFMFILVHSERWDSEYGAPGHTKTRCQESIMNKDQVKGRIEEAKGKVKEIAGNVVGNEDLAQEGKIQNAKGKVQAGYGDLKEDIKDAI